jgi:hypothetical protein
MRIRDPEVSVRNLQDFRENPGVGDCGLNDR